MLQTADLNESSESSKSKIFPWTVPIHVIALRDSVFPSWAKDFLKSQGSRSKLLLNFHESFGDIFSYISTLSRKSSYVPDIAADLVSLGDSWLKLAIMEAVVEPIPAAEDQDWYKMLNKKWKVFLHRNDKGDLDCNGKVFAVPYRWGSTVIAYKNNIFKEHKFDPIEDWGDLWRPELKGRISMVESAREVVGAVLKYMGTSYNVKSFETEALGGLTEVGRNLTMLTNQVRVFDDRHYLKALELGDVWVAVGPSSDIIPLAGRNPGIVVVAPKSGSSLWADFWVVPVVSEEDKGIGGRVRGPSPLIHQWIEFCLHSSRTPPGHVAAGASPLSLFGDSDALSPPVNSVPKIEINLVSGIPPAEILSKCEFLEPLPEDILSDYRRLLQFVEKQPGLGWGSRFRLSFLEKLGFSK